MFDANDRGLLRDLHTMLGAFKGGNEKGFYQPFFAEAAAQGTAQQIAALQATQRELVETIGRLVGGDDLDVDALMARIEDVIDGAMSDAAKLVKVQVSVDDANPAT